jgi:hypothetical protein
MRLLVLFPLIFPYLLLAQQPTASISRDQVEVGGRIDLIYKIELKKSDKFSINPLTGNFPSKLTTENSSLKTAAFDEIEIIGFEDTMILQGNKKVWLGIYELTPWDSGLVVLEGQRFTINDSTFDFPSVYLDCNLVPHKKGQGIYDIKETFVKTPNKQTWLVFFIKYIAWWLFPLIGFIIYRLISNKRNSKSVKIEKEMSLKERTLHAIDALEKAELWKKDQLKEHFVELSYILRSYLTARYSISLLDKTTGETKLLLIQKGLNKEIVDTILRLLSHSDMVKFAASEPAEELIYKSLFLLRQIVSETSPIEFEHAE